MLCRYCTLFLILARPFQDETPFVQGNVLLTQPIFQWQRHSLDMVESFRRSSLDPAAHEPYSLASRSKRFFPKFYCCQAFPSRVISLVYLLCISIEKIHKWQTYLLFYEYNSGENFFRIKSYLGK